MPLHETADPITSLIRFKTSTVLETLIAAQGVAASWRLDELTAEAREALGRVFLDEMRTFYEEFYSCCSLVELGVDCQDHSDVPGFLDYVRDMTDEQFAFYALGRWFSRESLAEPLSKDKVRDLIETSPHREELERQFPRIDWLDDVASLRERVVEMWGRFWEGFFSNKVDACADPWRRSILQKQQMLDANGGLTLFEHLTGYDSLPSPLPEDQPYSLIEVIPVCHSERKHVVYYGYGKIQILYDCTRTEEHDREVRASEERSLIALKALADENRLKILKLISQNERMLNGKSIAKKLELSPSVVSRHISQLKAGGFVEEYSPDNRNITYDFNLDRLRALGGDIEAYIRD